MTAAESSKKSHEVFVSRGSTALYLSIYLSNQSAESTVSSFVDSSAQHGENEAELGRNEKQIFRSQI